MSLDFLLNLQSIDCIIIVVKRAKELGKILGKVNA